MYTPGKSKEYIRKGVFDFFKDTCKHVITLPNLYFGLEKNLLDIGIKVDCSEYKVNTFKGAIQVKPKGITLFNKNVKNLDLSIYDGLFFDLYGTWNKNMEEALPRIKLNSKLVITFLMARENKHLQKRININKREDSYIKLLNTYGFRVIKYMNYCDTTPMCVFYCIKTN
jgi:hypothetical protein